MQAHSSIPSFSISLKVVLASVVSLSVLSLAVYVVVMLGEVAR